MTETDTLIEAHKAFTNLFEHVWFWKLDNLFNVIRSDCPHESLFCSLFLKDGRREARIPVNGCEGNA